MPLIHKLASTPNLSDDARLHRLSDLLSPCTNAICVSRLKILLAWPALQSAWSQFVRDVLEYHPSPVSVYTRTRTRTPDPHRFSSFLDLPSGTAVLLAPVPDRVRVRRVGHKLAGCRTTEPPTPSTDPTWRVRRDPSPLRTALRNIWRAVRGTESGLLSFSFSFSSTNNNTNTTKNSMMNNKKISNTGNSNSNTPQEEDLGLPSITLVARQLLAGLKQSESHPADLQHLQQHTCPVDSAVLSHCINQPEEVRRGSSWEGRGRRRACTVEDYYARFVLVCLEAVNATAAAATTATATAVPGQGLEMVGSSSASASSLSLLLGPSSSSDRGGGTGHTVSTTATTTTTNGINPTQVDETRRWRERMAWLRDPREVGSLQEQTGILVHVLLFLHCEKRERIIRAGGGLDDQPKRWRAASRRLFGSCWR
ncbi:hypothetical protein N658DRAFT_487987 [Parathielavia hyrcaniae]|uniref:Uncharacterized protein n=1 Tax=Parathielavia hyrcaniae TaxID=113614 RepID=A0AAN6PWD2_9PEZI|nr:hypothetical protein N658DRAFT_487987 [Parathielavia hyrcaniae]